MNTLALVLFLAVVNEGIIEYLGEPIPSRFKPHVAALLGAGLCVAFNADLFAGLGFGAQFPFVGPFFTGLAIGRGSNFLNDLYARNRTISVPATTVGHVEAVAERAEAKLAQ